MNFDLSVVPVDQVEVSKPVNPTIEWITSIFSYKIFYQKQN